MRPDTPPAGRCRALSAVCSSLQRCRKRAWRWIRPPRPRASPGWQPWAPRRGGGGRCPRGRRRRWAGSRGPRGPGEGAGAVEEEEQEKAAKGTTTTQRHGGGGGRGPTSRGLMDVVDHCVVAAAVASFRAARSLERSPGAPPSSIRGSYHECVQSLGPCGQFVQGIHLLPRWEMRPLFLKKIVVEISQVLKIHHRYQNNRREKTAAPRQELPGRFPPLFDLDSLVISATTRVPTGEK